MQVFYEIVEIKEMNVVTQSGNHCRDQSDDTEYIETQKLIATYTTHAACEEWIFNFFKELKTIRECISSYPNKNGRRQTLDEETNKIIHEFQRKFMYVCESEFFNSFKFEIKTRYIGD
jgi:hypothetical protein